MQSESKWFVWQQLGSKEGGRRKKTRFEVKERGLTQDQAHIKAAGFNSESKSGQFGYSPETQLAVWVANGQLTEEI